MSDPFTVVSTFSGTGGSSKGYEMAGFEVRLAVEWDDHAAECYRLNFLETPLYHGDVTKLTVEEALSLSGLEPGELDLFDGSPPCQGFSTSGKRELDDPRNTLFRDYARLLEGLRPKTFVMENVSGMVKGKMRLVFAQVLRTLRGCGYRVSARLMNAKWYGVPQSRERMTFIGVREDLGIAPSHPAGWGPPITAREALAGLPEVTERTLHDLGYWIWARAEPYQRWSLYHPKGHWFNSVTIHPDRPAPTIPATNGSRGGGSTVAHWAHPRCLTIAEVKRLFTFPDDFELVGNHTDQWKRLGNSVPPLLIKAVAEHIRDEILSPSTAQAA
ncbi:MAG: DNA cytosine methyltransferase [Actinomycetota bacterium]|nr:DNA cytosine methyltransferase [Actinomycetota bacterium]